MIRNPIPKVLSTLSKHRVRALLMGGQACILYGAAEFSRDVDVAIEPAEGNLARLRRSLAELQAEPVYVPDLSAAALKRGHACHFRCHASGLDGMRLDVMAKMRGVRAFAALWRRRVELSLHGAERVAVLSLPDLVCAKKTQRDKDWPMIRRLVEADVAAAGPRPAASRVAFWLRECRSPQLLIELAGKHRVLAARFARRRPALRAALEGACARLEKLLRSEEDEERRRDSLYWAPLKAELQRLRHRRTRSVSDPEK